MATGQPKTKAEDLGARIAALASESKPSEFTLRALRKDAEALRKDSPIEAADALGFLASLEGNIPEMRRNFTFALERRPNDFMIHANFGNALLRTDFFSEARTHLLRAIEINPSDLNTLNAAGETCIWTGWINAASEIVERYNKLSPHKPSLLTVSVSEALELVRNHGLSDENIELLIESAVSVMREAGHSAEWIRQRVLSDGESSWLSYHFSIAESVESVVELNVSLAERLAENQPRLRADEFVTVMFVSGISQ